MKRWRMKRGKEAQWFRFPFSLLFEALANETGIGGAVVSISIFAAVLCLCILVGHLLEENKWVNESITAIIIGCLAGTVILLASKGKNSHIVQFDEDLFFIYLLPPIISNAGFQVKKKQFFHNFLIIIPFGILGVFISVSIISVGSAWHFPKVGFKGLTVRDYLDFIHLSSVLLDFFALCFV